MTPDNTSQREDQGRCPAGHASAEVFVPAPVGLRRRVMFRVGLAAMAQRDHRKVRVLSGAGLMGVCLVVLAGVLACTDGRLVLWVTHHVPGALGYWDYLAGQSSASALAAVAVLASAGLLTAWVLLAFGRGTRAL